jgi:hypothetical protein
MKKNIAIFTLSFISIMLFFYKDNTSTVKNPSFIPVERALGETAINESARSCAVDKINDKIKLITDKSSSIKIYDTLPWDDMVDYNKKYNDTDLDGGFFSRGTLPLKYLEECYKDNVRMIAVGDTNNDTLPEIVVLKNGDKRLYLYNNKGVNFYEKTVLIPNINYVSSVTIFDVDGDSYNDIIALSPASNEIIIYYNDKNGHYNEGVVSKNIFDEDIAFSNGADWTITLADLNKDGLADILLSSRIFGDNAKVFSNQGKLVRPIRLFYNNNNKQIPFIEETKRAFLKLDNGKEGYSRSSFGGDDLGYPISGVYSTGVADFNNDGWLDLYGAGDLLRPFLFIARPGGTSYEDISIKSKIREKGQNTMGVSILDYNNDGYMDIIATDIDRKLNDDYYNRPAAPVGGHRLLINNKNLTFTDIGEKIGIADAGWGFGLSVLDQNLDGYFDFLVATGDYVTGRNEMHWPSTYDKPYLLLQNNNGFTKNGEGLLRAWRSPVVTPISFSGDLNRDFTPDIIFAGNETANPYYIINTTQGNSFNVTIRGKGLGGSPTGGEGAIITLKIKDRPTQVHSLPNLMSQFMASASNVPITFGLGDADKAEITVKFPSGVIVKKIVYNRKNYIIYE